MPKLTAQCGNTLEAIPGEIIIIVRAGGTKVKRVTKQFDYAINVLLRNSSIVMACGPNETWRDDCLAAVKLLRSARRGKGSRRVHANNSDYTAALRAELLHYQVSRCCSIGPICAHELATRLNSVVKAQQNCA